MITNYSAVQHERARTLFAKYGVTLEPGDTKSPADLQLTRVTKPIRMRVRRTCHRCETVFGSEKLCINCQHTRCTKCPRYPPARTTEPEPALRKPKLPEPSLPQPRIFCRTPHLKLSGFIETSLETSPRAGGQNLVHRPVRQRVHRFCHLCNSVFTPGSKDCQSCSHVRCKKCPRDPAKLDKYPDGYPGDVDPPKQRPERTFKKTRRRVHYVCHVCETWYQGSSDDCSNCGQTRCAKSIRIPYVWCLLYVLGKNLRTNNYSFDRPKKIKPEPSPEVLKSIEEKLASLMIAESQSQTARDC